MDSPLSIAVAGLRGNTCTGAMLAHILSVLESAPSWILGADLVGYGLRSRVGQGAGGPLILVATSSVSAEFAPDLCVFGGTDSGEVPAWIDQVATVIAPHREKFQLAKGAGLDNLVTYGPGPGATWTVDSRWSGSGCRIVARGPTREVLWADVPVPAHADNAMAALGAAMALGIAPMEAAAALESYRGVHRHLTIAGRTHSVTVIDSVARHHDSISADLAAARELTGGQGRVRVLAVADPSLAHTITVSARQAVEQVVTLEPPRPSHRIHRIVGARRPDTGRAVKAITDQTRPGDVVVVVGTEPPAEHLAGEVLDGLGGTGPRGYQAAS
ncbi:UDP-N-acetylmuramate-alanine ligase [Actinomadura mexicana]|uniref:UDP-N-acetylmuramate-alanine ligase n=1 Tax=Actinomadura mexicana TaxID=134959 RepID=A0A238XD48_9ACTN|nr:UDP-N-acetylmuramate-alanine ligase [Actinomadura mexicana]